MALQCRGLSDHAIARQRSGTDDDKQRVDARRDRNYGRDRLREVGVLPWIAFDDDLPEQWWSTQRFWETFLTWFRQTAARDGPIGSVEHECRAALAVLHGVDHLLTSALQTPGKDRPKGTVRTSVALALENVRNARDRLQRLAAHEGDR